MTLLQTILSQHKQVRRQLFDLTIASNKKVFKPNVKINGNNNQVSLLHNDSNADATSNGLQIANTMFKDFSDLIGSPARLINSIQQNWLVFFIFIAIILVLILILYCIIRYHCSSVGKICTKTGALGKLATRLKGQKKKPPPRSSFRLLPRDPLQ